MKTISFFAQSYLFSWKNVCNSCAGNLHFSVYFNINEELTVRLAGFVFSSTKWAENNNNKNS